MGNIASILNSIKKLHGIPEADTSFDSDLIIHINSALMILNQLGVGPAEGYFIEDANDRWVDYVQDRFIVESIKTFVYIKVRLVFDPPASPTVVDALKSSAKEYEWRITDWVSEKSQY